MHGALASVYPFHHIAVCRVVDDLLSIPPSRYKISQEGFSCNLSSSFWYSGAKFEMAKKVTASQKTY